MASWWSSSTRTAGPRIWASVRAGGEVVEIDRAGGTVTLEIYIKNADDTVISPGRAVVRLRD